MSAALQAIRRTVTVDWPKTGQRGAKDLLILTAHTGHSKIMADAGSKGLKPTWTAYANTPGNTNLDSVVLPGPIVYKYRYASDIVEFALDSLRRASPMQSGDYVRSHTLYVNGVAVQTLPLLKPGDDVFIANPIAYARRLEVGKTESGRDFVVQVEPHIYERVAKRLASKYRDLATVTFGYVSAPGAHVNTGTGLGPHYVAKGGIRRKRPNRTGEAVRSPAIFISLLT